MSKLPKVVRATECPGLQPKLASSSMVLCPLCFGFSAPLFILGFTINGPVSDNWLSQTLTLKPKPKQTNKKTGIINKPLVKFFIL